MTVARPVPRQAVRRAGGGVTVTLEDGRSVTGSHCLLTVGMVHADRGLRPDEAG